MGHGTEDGLNDDGESEGRGSRWYEGGKDNGSSLWPDILPPFSVLPPNLEGSGLYFNLEAVLLYRYKRCMGMVYKKAMLVFYHNQKTVLIQRQSNDSLFLF